MPVYSLYGVSLFSKDIIPYLSDYGVNIASANIEANIGYLPASAKELDLTIWYSSPYLNAQGKPELQTYQTTRGEHLFRLLYHDGFEVFLNRPATRLWISYPAHFTMEDLSTYLTSSIMGMVLYLRGIVALHSSAVVINGYAVAFVGPSGSGKSSTALTFAKRRRAVLSEDLLPLRYSDGQFEVLAGYPFIRLWPGMVATLWGNPEALPRMTPNWDKRCFERKQVDSAPYVESVTPTEGLIHLLANTYAVNLPDYGGMRAKEFDTLSRLMQTVPVRRVIPHADPRYTDKLCDVIEADFSKL
jgi:hypothetical protein